MDKTFEQIVDEVDSFVIPDRMEKFLIRERAPSASEQTLGFYAYSYARTFDVIVTSIRAHWREGGLLQLPLFYLARHSMELSLKWAIEEVSKYTPTEPEEAGHNLLKLWAELNNQFSKAGVPEGDAWGAHCARLVAHIHEIDPTGEAFRYPHNMKGKSFAYTRVEFDGLCKAHEHLTGYCSASVDMVTEGGGY